ncbi:MAG: nicotinate phosphoribosyltransferase [Candidatus Moraniibacteriota bacterium]
MRHGHTGFAYEGTGTGSPIRSLLDIDFYKFTMGQFIHDLYRDIGTTFELINRDADIPLAEIIGEKRLRDALDSARKLRVTDGELDSLRNMRTYGENLFSEPYLSFLKRLSLPPYELRREGDQYRLSFSGPWAAVSLWETVALAIVSELYYEALERCMTQKERNAAYALAEERLEQKLALLAASPDIRFADFGHRRRHGRAWHEWVVKRCAESLPDQFLGTSDTLLAIRYGVNPIGTNAHELPMVLATLAETDQEKRDAQYAVLEGWQRRYGKAFRIFLPDTFGTGQFLEGAPRTLAHEWDGFRQDSGDPMRAVGLYVSWLRSHGVDPKEKLVIFSDGLDIPDMRRLERACQGNIRCAFGWGTLLTNDFRGCGGDGRLYRPFSLVCKAVSANGRPVIKLSDNVGKATGPASEVKRYLDIFGRPRQDDLRVIV